MSALEAVISHREKVTMQKGSVVITSSIATASPKIIICCHIYALKSFLTKKVSEGHSYKKPRHNGRKQYESLLFHALWRKRGESSTVFSAQKGSSSHLFPIFAMPQPPALSQKHSLHSPAQWKTSLAGTKAGQHNP